MPATGSERSAVEIAAAVRSGQSARVEVQAALTRIAAGNDAIDAFRVIRSSAALAEADAVDAHSERGTLPLAGVPVSIKDNVPVAGETMTNGSEASDPAPQSSDHEVVRRLRAAGAVVVGLTRVPELCVYGATDTPTSITRNPWNREYTPGGSSGGAAASVAAGMVPVAHGNDGMGSIRIPSACAGLVGIKGGLGVVPADLGNGSWFDMSENGPLATTVADCALVFSVLAGRPELAAVGDAGRLRIAVSTRRPTPGLPVAAAWKAAAQDSARALREAGHTVRQADPAYGTQVSNASIARWMAGVELDARLLTDRTKLLPRTRRQAAIGRLVLRAGYPKDSGRTNWQQRAERFFADHDVLITPTLAGTPLKAVHWSTRPWLVNVAANSSYAPFAAPWNLAGWPAMAVPAGVGPHGLPLSVQLVGRPGSEATLLALAAQLEQLRPWRRTAVG